MVVSISLPKSDGVEWAKTISHLEREGLLTAPREVLPLVYIAGIYDEKGRTKKDAAPHGWSAVAHETASRHGGSHMPLSGGGMRYGDGRNLGGIIFKASVWPGIELARSIVNEICKVEELPVSTGGCAKLLLLHVSLPQYPDKYADDVLVGGGEWQYHDCVPGRYTHATMYDCSGYYFNLMSRAPGLAVSTNGEQLYFPEPTPNEAAKWREVLGAVQGVKTLRNSLYGVAMGSGKGKPFFTRDKVSGLVEQKMAKFGKGPFRPFALAVARTAWELCLLESMSSNSVYSTVDSVTCLPGDYPKIWDSFGIPYDIRRTKGGKLYSGEADICSRGVWSVNGIPTKWYEEGDRYQVEAERPDIPAHLYCHDWL